MQQYYTVVRKANRHTGTVGGTFWFKDPECTILHRVGAPAVEWVTGSAVWYLDGVKHRTDGPAVDIVDGYRSWYVHGKLHRTDGPAIERPDGSKTWFLDGRQIRESEFKAVTSSKGWRVDRIRNWLVNGVKHRADGPAIERADGHKEWFFNNIRHCVYGPAVEPAPGKGRREWWLDGKKITKAEHAKRTSIIEMTIVDIEAALGYKIKLVG